ncbi:hypothetical protein E2C01_078882 [Portunus trituberculatus]|uniref:Uncharacterized protein n=1 Tax=Portunus trituberculatus TaxID=210409 RepID=A0A5B7IVB3_PORTR|nr:hypothetical protein [Portunus trituberculatus]
MSNPKHVNRVEVRQSSLPWLAEVISSGEAQVYSSGGRYCGVCAASFKHASLNTSPPSPHPKHAHMTTVGKLTNTPPSSPLPASHPPSTCLSGNPSGPPITLLHLT